MLYDVIDDVIVFVMTLFVQLYCVYLRNRSDFYISAPFRRTIANQNDFFIVVFHVGIIKKLT